MSEEIRYTSTGGTTVLAKRYTQQELEDAWGQDGQGHEQVQQLTKNRWNLVAPCNTREEAVELSAVMVRKVFAIPTCAFWDGEVFVFYCGDAGRGARACLNQAHRVYSKFLREGPEWIEEESGPLFAQS